jgi:hypothetical protein
MRGANCFGVGAKSRSGRDTSKATAVENIGVKACVRAVERGEASGDAALKAVAAAADIRNTAAAMRMGENTRFRFKQRGVFIF